MYKRSLYSILVIATLFFSTSHASEESSEVSRKVTSSKLKDLSEAFIYGGIPPAIGVGIVYAGIYALKQYLGEENVLYGMRAGAVVAAPFG